MNHGHGQSNTIINHHSCGLPITAAFDKICHCFTESYVFLCDQDLINECGANLLFPPKKCQFALICQTFIYDILFEPRQTCL